jgi:hypothetical protein
MVQFQIKIQSQCAISLIFMNFQSKKPRPDPVVLTPDPNNLSEPSTLSGPEGRKAALAWMDKPQTHPDQL